jgi:hypothetical protein
MEILRSRLLAGLPHGFTTRDGGASAAPFDRLNLGDLVGDDPAAVAENWRRLEAASGLAFARVRQVHGAEVVEAEGPGLPRREADAVVSRRPGLAACVAVADCVPVLLADPGANLVAAVHAGWRGTLARAAAAGVAALGRAGSVRPRRRHRPLHRPVLLPGVGGAGRPVRGRLRPGGGAARPGRAAPRPLGRQRADARRGRGGAGGAARPLHGLRAGPVLQPPPGRGTHRPDGGLCRTTHDIGRRGRSLTPVGSHLEFSEL